MMRAATDKEAAGRRILAMDTATGNMSVALVENGVPVAAVDTAAERNHSVYLQTTIAEVLAGQGWSPKDLTGVAAGRGPGSYTGVRIGVTAAKTMAWTLGIPVSGLSTLEAMAGGAWSEAGRPAGRGWFVPLLNARRGQAFTGWFERKSPDGIREEDNCVFGADWRRKREDGIRLVDRWSEELLQALRESPDTRPEAVVFTGETGFFEGELERFAKEAESLGCRTSVLTAGIGARFVGLLGAARFAAGDLLGAHELLPNYTQLPEAEVNYLAGKR